MQKSSAEKPPVAAWLPAAAPEQRWRTTVELVILQSRGVWSEERWWSVTGRCPGGSVHLVPLLLRVLCVCLASAKRNRKAPDQKH